MGKGGAGRVLMGTYRGEGCFAYVKRYPGMLVFLSFPIGFFTMYYAFKFNNVRVDIKTGNATENNEIGHGGKTVTWEIIVGIGGSLCALMFLAGVVGSFILYQKKPSRTGLSTAAARPSASDPAHTDEGEENALIGTDCTGGLIAYVKRYPGILVAISLPVAFIGAYFAFLHDQEDKWSICHSPLSCVGLWITFAGGMIFVVGLYRSNMLIRSNLRTELAPQSATGETAISETAGAQPFSSARTQLQPTGLARPPQPPPPTYSEATAPPADNYSKPNDYYSTPFTFS